MSDKDREMAEAQRQAQARLDAIRRQWEAQEEAAQAAQKRFDAADWQRLRKDMVEADFDDSLLDNLEWRHR